MYFSVPNCFDRLMTIHDTQDAAAQARSANAPATEPAPPAPAKPPANAEEVRREPAAAPAPEPSDIADRGLFQPTWARLRWHLCFDAAVAAAGVAGGWVLCNEPPAWDSFTVTFLILAVPTTLVSFGPPRVRRFFNRMFS